MGMGISMRRTEPKIQMDVLEALTFNGPLKLTNLTCRASINFKKLEKLLGYLIAHGLVNKREVDSNNVVYLITPKGLKIFKDLQKQNVA
jgi:predicted transcriptional regulator